MNSKIINTEFDFTYNNTSFSVKFKYESLPFGVALVRYWKFELYKVNNKELKVPLTDCFTQKIGWFRQIREFREKFYYLSTTNKVIKNGINLYPLIQKEVLYLWLNKDTIAKYKEKIKIFDTNIKAKYNKKIVLLKEQKRSLKKKLKLGHIDYREYQERYKIIREKIDDINFEVKTISKKYYNRYFKCCKLRNEIIN